MDRVPFASFDDLPMNLRYSPAIKGRLVGSSNMHRWSNSHRKLIYRIAQGLAEIVQFLCVDSLVKRYADTGIM